MPRNRESLQYALKHGFDFSDNHHTEIQQHKNIDRFATWAKRQGLTIDDLRADPQAYLQAYYNDCKTHYSVATAYNYAAYPCKALGVKMSDIDTVPRTIDKITRGRGGGSARGQQQATQEKYARLMALQTGAGIRRDEIAHLVGRDLHRDADGTMWVDVRKGKHGKHQRQIVAPAHAQAVAAVFDGTDDNQRIMTPSEMNNNINLHGVRAVNAREQYDRYVDMGKTAEGRDKLDSMMMAAFANLHPAARKAAGAAAEAIAAKWLAGMRLDNRPYRLRGANRAFAAAQGLPTEYDRRAILAVSILHLSHWRLDVTVKHYLLAI